jgi:hypothetical protein
VWRCWLKANTQKPPRQQSKTLGSIHQRFKHSRALLIHRRIAEREIIKVDCDHRSIVHERKGKAFQYFILFSLLLDAAAIDRLKRIGKMQKKIINKQTRAKRKKEELKRSA